MRIEGLKTDRWHGRLCLVIGASVLMASGCQETPTTVTGLVTLDGKPLAIRSGMRGTVVFQPTSGIGNTLNGNIDAVGRYELTAGSSNQVPPSVYWVAVSAVEIVPPTADHPEPTGKRITPAKYANTTDSGLRVEVVPGPNKVNLPLSSDESSVQALEAVDKANVPSQDAGQESAERDSATQR